MRSLGRVLVVAALAVCGALAAWYVWLYDPDESQRSSAWSGTKAFLTPLCLIAGMPPESLKQSVESAGGVATIAETVLIKLVDAGYDTLVRYLAAQREAYNATTAVKFAGLLYQREGQGIIGRYGCLQIARGTFVTANQTRILTDAIWTEPRLRSMGLREPPEFYLELRFVYANQGADLLMTPATLDYRKTAAKRGRSGNKDLFVTVALRRNDIEKDKEITKTFMFFSLSLPDVRIGARLNEEVLAGVVAGMQRLPSYRLTQISPSGGRTKPSPGESGVAATTPTTTPTAQDAPGQGLTTPDDADLYGPMRQGSEVDLIDFEGLVTVTETSEPSAIFTALSATLSDNKGTVTSETEKLIHQLLTPGENKSGSEPAH